MRRVLVVCCLCICVFCWTKPTLGAVEYKEVAELTVQANQIVIGDVVEITSFWNARHDLIISRIVVDVTDYLVGEGTGIEVLEMSGGTVDGLTLCVSVLPVFELGDHVLLFLGDSEIRLVESFQGAYLTDGELVARTAPGCGRVIEESLQPLRELLDEIQQALPPGTSLPETTPYDGDFEIPPGARYGLCGFDWTYKANPMGEDYKINANCVDGSAGDASSQRTQIQNGAAAWNNAGADFAFTYGGTSSQTAVNYNGTNLVYFDMTPPGGGGYVAATYIWYSGGSIGECDMVFNDRDYTWWNGSGFCSGMMDIWNIATHELGHFLCLADLYGGGDVNKTMYGYVSYCETKKRTLHSDDINGIIAIYGAGGPGGYCSASSSSTSYEYISNVTVGSINNSSGSSGYADYTAQSTDMQIGTGYPITVTIGNPYSSDIGGLWVDWNQDEDFYDAGETITTAWSGGGPYAGTITPPAGATLGGTRMRVRIQDFDYDPTLSPCGDTSYGEVEDYTINVIDVGDTTPPSPDPMTFATPPYAVGTSAIMMIATTATDDSPPVLYYFDFVSGGSGGSDGDWQLSTAYADYGLAVNTAYTYRVKARDNASPPNETAYSSPASAATLANVPGAPSLSNATLSTLDLNVNPNGNPSHTVFAIRCTGTSPSDSTWNDKYVNASGQPSTSAVWQLDGQWGTITVQGLEDCTEYTFAVKARNLDFIETAFGPSSTLRTALWADLDGDNEVNLSDLSLLLANYGVQSGATYNDGDLDGDGDVDLSDLSTLLAVYGTTCP